jgi:hypothetical protein
MTQYLLSVHSVDGEVGDPMTEEEVQQSWKQIQLLNEELKSAGAWVFSGRLHQPDTATVVRISDGEVVTTRGLAVRRHRGLTACATATPQPPSTRPRSPGSAALTPICAERPPQPRRPATKPRRSWTRHAHTDTDA